MRLDLIHRGPSMTILLLKGTNQIQKLGYIGRSVHLLLEQEQLQRCTSFGWLHFNDALEWNLFQI